MGTRFVSEFRAYYRAARRGAQPAIGKMSIHRAIHWAWLMASWAVKHG
jgi:hypothetical protein